MSIPILNNLDLNQNQLLNAVLQNLASDPVSPVEGQIWHNTTSHLTKYYTGSATIILYDSDTANTASKLVRRDGSGDFAAHDITANKVTGLATPSGSSDAANKAYVDAAITGLDWKASCRVATTANIDLASAPAAIDGITLSSTNRVLVKDQTDKGDNGIYVFNGAGSAMTRATDADTDAEVTANMAVFIAEGSTNASTGWVLGTVDTITLGTTDLEFSQFTGGTVTAGDGMTQSGNTLNVVTASSSRIVVAANSIDLATTAITPGTYTSLTVDAYGRATAGADIVTSNGLVARTASGTFVNRSVAVGAGLSVSNGDGVAGNPTVSLDTSVVVRKYATDIGDTSTTEFTITHSLGTRDIQVLVRDNNSPYAQVLVDVEAATTNTVVVRFAVAPGTNRYRVIVQA